MNNMPSNANDLAAEMTGWRHDFHQYPELGFEEHRTAKKVAGLLHEFGLDVHEQIGGTGVVGILKNGSGTNSIGLRADMDALAITEANSFSHKSKHDGRMHACGHDGHMSMLLGAAKRLAADRSFDGTVVFIFQPAEEHGRGALAMIEDGLFGRFQVNSIYGIHNMPSMAAGDIAMREGPIMACEDNFEITVHGKGGHAAMPHLSIDPIVVGCQIVVALQSVVSRSLDPTENGVLSVTDFSVEATRNAIPQKVILSGDTRAFTPQAQTLIETTMQRLVAGICAAHGAEHEFTYSREFAATVNSPQEANIAAGIARETFGADKVDADCEPVMASEDFGFMLQHRPGCYLFLGNRGENTGGVGLHNPRYDFNDDILTSGADFWVGLVQSRLGSATGSV
jgi:amidohydrolase